MVNEDLSSHLNMLFEVATKATSFYDLPDDLKITLINLTENATYKVEAPDGQRWALRVHRRGYHARDAIASELAWQQDLRNTGVVTTPKTVTGKNSELIQDISDGKSQAPHHVVLSEWEAGLEPGIGENLIVTFQQLGEIAARMHRHARQWQRPTVVSTPHLGF